MSDLPTKPGPYYWLEKDGGQWVIRIVDADDDGELHVLLDDVDIWLPIPIKPTEQWLPIPPAEELMELQAKAKMLDEGIEAWAVFAPNGNPMIIAMTEQEVINETGSPQPKAWEALQCHGFTCEPVTIYRNQDQK